MTVKAHTRTIAKTNSTARTAMDADWVPVYPERESVGTEPPVEEPEVGPEKGPEVGPEKGPEVGPAVGSEVGPEKGPEVGPAVGSEVGPEVGPAVGSEVGPPQTTVVEAVSTASTPPTHPSPAILR